MPYGTPAQLANLKPFQAGNKQPRASAAKLRAMTMCRLAAPECVEFALSVMRDPAERTETRLKAMDAILRIAFPAKSVAHADLAENEHPGPQYLQIRFVSPDGTERSYDEFTQARHGAKVVDEQPIDVTPQRLPLPSMVRDAEPEIPALPPQAPRQDELILARPEGKMPSWRARNAAGIFR